MASNYPIKGSSVLLKVCTDGEGKVTVVHPPRDLLTSCADRFRIISMSISIFMIKHCEDNIHDIFKCRDYACDHFRSHECSIHSQAPEFIPLFDNIEARKASSNLIVYQLYFQ